MVNLTIDGNKYEVPEGTTVLQAARLAGIDIPTLCDHPTLTPYGGCRLCLVEIEGARTLQPSCTMPVNNNMVVRTDTPRVKEARKFVLTLIFSERNHFCMYCQVSGGDCELQNSAYREGMTHWPLSPNYQPYQVDASHPYFVLDQNRCILCRRCVRACGELVGNFTLGFEERGAESLLVADFGAPLGESTCISCGTCLQVCPTGALIDRDSAYHGRETQVQHTKTACIGCSLGCGVDVLTRDNHLVRIDGDWDAAVNGGVLCKVGRFQPQIDDRDRDRILTPLVRKNGSLKAATWDEALETVALRLQPLAGKNGDGLAAIASTRLPAEALSTFKQLFSGHLHGSLVTSTEEGSATAAASAVARELGQSFEGPLAALKAADCVVLAGVDLVNEHEVAGFFVKRSLPNGVKLVTIDAQPNTLAPQAQLVIKVAKDGEAGLFNALAGSLSQTAASPAGISPETLQSSVKTMVEVLGKAKKPVFVYGDKLSQKTAVQAIKAIVEVARLTNGTVLSVKGGANSVAAAAYGLESSFALAGQQAVYVALGDDTLSQSLSKALEAAPFLAVQAAYHSPVTARADVVLPVEMWAEQEGHFINLEGRVQEAHRALTAPEGIRSNLDVLADLASRMGLTVNPAFEALPGAAMVQIA